MTLLSCWVLSGQTIPAFFDFCYGLNLSHNMGKNRKSLSPLLLFFMVVFKVIFFVQNTTFKNKMTKKPGEALC